MSENLKRFLFPNYGINSIEEAPEAQPVAGAPNYSKNYNWQQLLLQLKDVPFPKHTEDTGKSIVLKFHQVQTVGEDATEVEYSVAWEHRLVVVSYNQEFPFDITGDGRPEDPLNFKLEYSQSANQIIVAQPDKIEYKNPQEVDFTFTAADASVSGTVTTVNDNWDTSHSLVLGVVHSTNPTNLTKTDLTGIYAGNLSPKAVSSNSVKSTVTTTSTGIETESELLVDPAPVNSLVVTAAGTNVPNSKIAWDNINKIITFTDNKGNTQPIDLSQFVSDIHVNNAAFDPLTSILTLHMEDVDGTPVPDITIDLGELSKSKIEQSLTVQLSGNGTGVTPLRADVKVSSDAGNDLEIKADGLFVSVASAITTWWDTVTTSFTRTLLGRSDASQIRDDLELDTSPQDSDFTALAGHKYWLNGDITVTLPPASEGGQIIFTKAIGSTPLIKTAGTDEVVTTVGADSEIIFDVEALIVFTSNGTNWEL